jgi:hypothetical protein
MTKAEREIQRASVIKEELSRYFRHEFIGGFAFEFDASKEKRPFSITDRGRDSTFHFSVEEVEGIYQTLKVFFTEEETDA